MTAEPRQAAILFADIGGSVKLYEQVGDVEAHRRVAESLAFMRTAIERQGGVLLRTVGDSSLARFDTCDAAYQAACEMQHLHAEGPLSVRVGFHVGPVIHDGGDVYGKAVNIAARIAEFARTDEIAASADAVARLAPANRTRAVLLETREVKGVSGPLDIHRLEWQGHDSGVTQVADRPSREVVVFDDVCMDIVRGGVQLTVDADCPSISVGRAATCDLAVDDEQASRRHASLELSRGQFLLIDDSTNGTWLVRESRTPVLVRRETVVLEGSGRLGLGARPEDSDALPIAFRVSGGQGG